MISAVPQLGLGRMLTLRSERSQSLIRLALAACLFAAASLAAMPHALAQSDGARAKPRTKVIVTPKRSAWRGYGFLPGYTQPPNLADPYARRRGDPNAGTYPWWGWPGFYRGRWNGGGLGPCWTKTPIGPIWNCG